jgi:uncharacterized membrane protein YphA (DoxX/SURF4 family)
MRRDPAAGPLFGSVLLFGLLALPVSLILAVIALIAIGRTKSTRSRRKAKVDREFAARFRELENTILGANPTGPRRRRLP